MIPVSERSPDLQYYYRNRDRIRERTKARYHANPEAARIRNRENYANNRERILGYKRKHRVAHAAEYAARAKAKRLARGVPAHDYLHSRWGLTKSQYDAMAESQHGVCAVCSKPDITGRRLAVDHCHKTGKLRGLLCYACNTALGRFNDDVSLLSKAIKYLQHYDKSDE